MMVERSALTMTVMLLSLKLKEHWRRGSRKTVRAGRWGGWLGNTSSSHTTAVAITNKTGLVNSQLWMVGSFRDCSPPPNHWLLIDFERGRGIAFRCVPVGEHTVGSIDVSKLMVTQAPWLNPTVYKTKQKDMNMEVGSAGRKEG